jgi:phosphoribosylglycinamide formyltransferase-1
MRLGLITYEANHLKTEQVAMGLQLRGYTDLTFFSLPFVQRPGREIFFAHRPDMAQGAHTREIAIALDAPYFAVSTPDAIPADGADLFLILGAGLLPPEFVRVTRGRVLNAHPGIIPLVRGLDAFKWAIVDGMPIGNSLHYIDEEADAGEVLGIVRTPLFSSDTLETFARRHYEIEIQMMIGFEGYLKQPSPLNETARPPRMRMPADIQAVLRKRFDTYKERFAVRQSDAAMVGDE